MRFISSSQTHTPYSLQRSDTLVIFYTYLSGFYPVLIFREKLILTPTFLVLCPIIIIYRPFAKRGTNNTKNRKQKWKAVIQLTVAVLLITVLHT
jgi:NhaP-type Na+/H+ or K+/H+ antiporter